MLKPRTRRRSGLEYKKITNAMRINIIYSRSILKLSVSQISKEIGIKYNSIMNILKCARAVKDTESSDSSNHKSSSKSKSISTNIYIQFFYLYRNFKTQKPKNKEEM